MKKIDFKFESKAQKSPYYLPALILMIIGVVVLGYFQVPAYEKKEVSQPVAEAVIEATFDYEIKANADTMLWAAGEVMEKGMPLYFNAVNPSVTMKTLIDTGELRYKSGEVVLSAYLESVDRNESVFWSELVTRKTFAITPGNEEIEPMEFDFSKIYAFTKEITEDLNFRKGNQRLMFLLSAQLDEEKLEHQISFVLENEGVVPPPKNKLSSKREVYGELVQKIMVARTFNDYLRCGYFWIYAITIIVLIIVAVFSYNAEQKSEYQRYEKFISLATLKIDKEPDAYFHSLKELIEMSVELDKKVIYDSARETYYILDGEKVYAHKKEHGQA